MWARRLIFRSVLMLLVTMAPVLLVDASDHCTCEPTPKHWSGWDSTFELPDLSNVFRSVELAVDRLEHLISENAQQMVENVQGLKDRPFDLHLIFTNVRLGDYTLHWDPVTGADSYRVIIRSGDKTLVTRVISNWASVPVDVLCAAGSETWDVTLRANINGELLVEATGIVISCA